MLIMYDSFNFVIFVVVYYFDHCAATSAELGLFHIGASVRIEYSQRVTCISIYHCIFTLT